MSNPNYRVEIPINPKELIDLAALVYNKHTELGPDSPLNALESHKWSDHGPKVAEAAQLHKQAEELKRQSEEATSKCNLLLGGIGETVKASRDLLQGVYRENPRTLGQFGFNVSESVRKNTKKQAQ